MARKSRLLLKSLSNIEVYQKEQKLIYVEKSLKGSGLYYIMIAGPIPKLYIGQSEDFEQRMQAHRTELFNNKHSNPHLQNAFNKYQIAYIGLQDLLPVSQLDSAEIECISEMELQNTKFGYNIKPGGKSHHQLSHTEDTKAKMSEAHLGSKNSTKRTVYEYDLDGNFIREWDCAMNAVRHYGYTKSRIDQCCKQNYKAKSFMGRQWRYDKYNKIPPISRSNNSMHLTNIAQYTLEGVLLKVFKNTKEIKSSTGIKSHIVRAAIHEQRPGAGYIWKLQAPTNEN